MNVPRRVVFAAVVATGCQTSSSGSGGGPSREALLGSLASTVFVPTYVEFAAASAELASSAASLCEAPTAATLQAAREQWRVTRQPLKQAEAWAFGPIKTLNIETAVDFWPIRPDAAEAAFAMGEAPTPQWVESQGTAAKGLPVVEYLLFAPIGDDAMVLASLDVTTDQGAHRCAVAQALALQTSVRAEELRAAWDPADGGFADRLSADGDDTPGNPSLKMAIGDVINGVIFVLQDITDAKMGRPLGFKNGGTPQPDDVESRFSDNDRADMLANLQGAALVYLGDGDIGLTDVIVGLDPALDASIRSQFDRAREAIAGLEQPLRLSVVDGPAPVETARDVVRDLRRLFEVDLATLLGINVALSDNDGD